MQIEGPVAAQFQALFFATWTRAGGEIDSRRRRDTFPRIEPVGPELVAAVATDADDATKRDLCHVLSRPSVHASQRLWLTQAYFAPNGELRQRADRGRAARRRRALIVPGFTDSGLIFHASRTTYDELLAGGVRIYEQRDALLHAKTLVIDSALSMVGSANFDMRSFLHNNEVNAVVVGSDFARRMEQSSSATSPTRTNSIWKPGASDRSR